MKLVWREAPSVHYPWGVQWELVDEELRFNDGDVSAWLSPIYGLVRRTAERRYEATTMHTSRTPTVFRSLKRAKAWARALAVLNQ